MDQCDKVSASIQEAKISSSLDQISKEPCDETKIQRVDSKTQEKD